MEAFSALLALGEMNPPVTGGFPSQRPVTRSCFLSSAPEKKTVEQKIKVPVIWNAIALIMTPFQWESDESNTHCVFGAPVLRWWQWLTPSYWPPWLRLYQKGMCGDSTHGNARLLCPWAAIIDNFTVGEKRPHAIINRSLGCWINVTFYMIYLGLRGVKKSHWHFHQLVPIYW